MNEQNTKSETSAKAQNDPSISQIVSLLNHALTALPNTRRNSASYESITNALHIARNASAKAEGRS